MDSIATCTASPLTGAEKTIRLLPAGIFRAIDGRPVGLPGWQLPTGSAAAIVRAAASRSDDFVIDYEHQTLQAAKNGQPAPAAGWFKKLEWREGQGLFAVDVRWTARATAMIKAGEYRYISPVFGFDSKTGAVQYIQSAAITNFAALDGLTDIAAAKGQAITPQADSTSAADIAAAEHCQRVVEHCLGNQVLSNHADKATVKLGDNVYHSGGFSTSGAFETAGCSKHYK